MKIETVTKATVVGENCATCKYFRAYSRDNVYIVCGFMTCGVACWDAEGKPTHNTAHPPGDSVCPEWEKMG